MFGPGPLHLRHRSLRIVQGQGAEGGETFPPGLHDCSEFVVDDPGQLNRPLGGFHMGSGSGHGEHLHVDAGLIQDLGPEVHIAMTGNHDVVVAGIVQQRIAVVDDIQCFRLFIL